MFVKICGITTPDDALLAAGLGADAVGLVFAASSRRVTTGTARNVVSRLPPVVLTVGVFRNERKERVVEVANTVGLRAVQLHGHESAEDTQWIAERVPAVIRAFAASDPALARYEAYGDVRLLVDASEPGSGETFDWSQPTALPPRHPFILAGGLTPDNVTTAIAELDPWGVDVSTGVEAEPGRKDPVKLQRFIAAARSVPSSDDVPAGEPFDWEDETAWR